MQTFFLIDLNNYFSRFFYANSETCIERYLLLIKDSIREFSPTWICNCIDAPISFRKGVYNNYKSNREVKPAEYYSLLNLLKFNLQKFKYPIQTSKSLEAEDICSLFIENLKTEDIKFVVLSNDKDVLQLEDLNNDRVRIFDYFNRKNEEGVKVKFVQKSIKDFSFDNVEQLTLYLALRGDASDNIPGVPGIGEKTATTIIQMVGGIDDIYT
jgi:DNA polymerase-1